MFIGQRKSGEFELETSPLGNFREPIPIRNWSREKSQQSRSRSRSAIRNFNLYGSKQGSAERSPNRPTIVERFNRHQDLLDAKRIGTDLDYKISQ